jgi:ParB family chromosome partitioning protein
MAMSLGTKVRIVSRSEKSGRLEIEYYSKEDLQRIYEAIVGSR